jgi:hypothetical protein
MPDFIPYVHVLIIRIWYEPSGDNDFPAAWRCVVEDAESMERVYFSSRTNLMAFLFEKIRQEENH